MMETEQDLQDFVLEAGRIQVFDPPREIRWRELRLSSLVSDRSGLEAAMYDPSPMERYIEKPCAVILHRATRRLLWAVFDVAPADEIPLLAALAGLAAGDEWVAAEDKRATEQFEQLRRTWLLDAGGSLYEGDLLSPGSFALFPLRGEEGKVLEVDGCSVFLEGGTYETRNHLETILHSLPLIPRLYRGAGYFRQEVEKLFFLTSSLKLVEALHQGEGVLAPELYTRAERLLSVEQDWDLGRLQMLQRWLIDTAEALQALEASLKEWRLAGSSPGWVKLYGSVSFVSRHVIETQRITKVLIRKESTPYPARGKVMGHVVLTGSLSLLLSALSNLYHFEISDSELYTLREILTSACVAKASSLLGHL